MANTNMINAVENSHKRRALCKIVLAAIVICLFGIAFIYLFRGYPDEAYYQKIVRGIESLHKQANVSWPRHLVAENAELDGTEFKCMDYFSVLQHLTMRDDFILDYVYNFFGGGGQPVFYVRKISDPRLLSYEEYLGYTGLDLMKLNFEKSLVCDPNMQQFQTIEMIEEFNEALQEKRKEYLLYLQTDDSPGGFFELAVCHLIAGQYYLFWHSCYWDTKIIVSKSDIISAMKDIPLSQVMARLNALNINIEPQITLTNDKATVRIVTFTKWGGFMQETYVFAREFPHEVLEHDTDTLVEYDCLIMF